jgi:protein-disulfide isomerase
MVSKFFLRFIVSGLIIAVAAAQQPQSEGPRQAIEKPAIEEIVKQYILQHPEVLVESVRLYQERERTAQREWSKQAVLANLNDLQRDPSSPVAGPDGGITVVEFFDYRCGYCKRAEPAVAKVLADHPEVRFIFKEFPILGPESSLGAKAGLAAARQGGYLKFHQALMTLPGPITMHVIEELAGRQGLDVSKLKRDMQSSEVQSVLARNRELGIKLGVNATPTFVVGSESVSEALDDATFERILAQAKRSSAPRGVENSRK